jgi:hypothetical protein
VSQYDDNPRCPYCGHIERDPWDHDWGSSECITTYCGECDREYVLTAHRSVTYSTMPGDDPATLDAFPIVEGAECPVCGGHVHETEAGERWCHKRHLVGVVAPKEIKR